MVLRRYRTVLMMMALVGSLTCHADQSKTYDLSGFTGVNASFAVDVELTQGDAFSVVAITKSSDFNGLELRVEDGVLIATRPEEQWEGKNTSTWRQFFDIESGNKKISTKRDNGDRVITINGESVPAYTVRVTAPSIIQIVASTSSSITAKGIKTRDLAVKATSSGDINAEVAGGDVSVGATSSGHVILSGTYDILNIKSSSSADVVVSGTSEELNIKATSSGDVKADKLISRQLDLRGTSASTIRAKASGGDVSIAVTSSGDVTLSGTCNELDIKATSGSNVEASDLKCQKGNLRATSGADIIAMLTETVEAHASSAGDILVRGGATPIEVTESSGGGVSIHK